jgi:hypothetical protein
MPTKERIAAIRIVHDAWNAFPEDFVEPNEVKAAEALVEKALNEAKALGLDRQATAEHVIGSLYADITDPGEDSLLVHYAHEHWPETLKPETDFEHAIYGGATCPYCRTELLEANGQHEIRDGHVIVPMKCTVCKAEYRDRYKLNGWLEA